MPDPLGPVQATVKTVAVKLISSPDEQTHRTIRNTGANVVTLSRDVGTAAGAGFKLAASAEIRVVCNPGESIYGICAAAQESTVEII